MLAIVNKNNCSYCAEQQIIMFKMFCTRVKLKIEKLVNGKKKELKRERCDKSNKRRIACTSSELDSARFSNDVVCYCYYRAMVQYGMHKMNTRNTHFACNTHVRTRTHLPVSLIHCWPFILISLKVKKLNSERTFICHEFDFEIAFTVNSAAHFNWSRFPFNLLVWFVRLLNKRSLQWWIKWCTF